MNLNDKNQTILHWATKRQAWNCVQEIVQLFQHEAVKLILTKDKNGVTALHLAAMLDSEKILKVKKFDILNSNKKKIQ